MSNEPGLHTNASQPSTGKSRSFKSLVWVLALVGAFWILIAWASFALAVASADPSNPSAANVISSTGFGVLLIICSVVLAKGKALVIWLFGFFVLATIAYSFLMGYGFNYLGAAFGVVVIWHMLSLKKKGEIT